MRAPGRAGFAIVSFALLVGVAFGAGARPAAAGGTSLVFSVTLSGNGQGYYRTEDGFINCVRSGGITSGSCKHTYDLSGGAVYYAAVYASESGSCLVSGDSCAPGGLGDASFLYPGDPDSNVGITFRLVDPAAVTVKKSGTGSGTVKSTPRGINCGTDCKSDYGKGSSLTLKATAKSGSKFSKWVGGPCEGKGSTCTFNVGGPYTITAVFTKSATATAEPEVTEPPITEPPTTNAPTTPGPTPVVPTPFPSTATVPSTVGPVATSAPPTSPAANEGVQSTLVLALGSLLAIILAAGGLYAMRSRRSPAPAVAATGDSPPSPPPPPPPAPPSAS